MYFGIMVLMIMLIASVTDIRSRQIPLFFIGAVASASVMSIIYDFYVGGADYKDILLSLLPGALLLLIAFLTKQGVGYGDGLLLLAAGPALGGAQMTLGVMAALFANGILSAVLLALKRAGKNTRIPFVPFLTLGLGVMFFAKG